LEQRTRKIEINMEETAHNTGWFAVILAFFMNVWNFLAQRIQIKDINDLLVLITTILAMGYMFHRFRRERRLDKKEREQNNKN